jgi:hypothetical protein
MTIVSPMFLHRHAAVVHIPMGFLKIENETQKAVFLMRVECLLFGKFGIAASANLSGFFKKYSRVRSFEMVRHTNTSDILRT